MMPSYEFACKDCGRKLTIKASIREISNLRPTCPECLGDMRRVFAANGIIFKGTGWAGKKPPPKKKEITGK